MKQLWTLKGKHLQRNHLLVSEGHSFEKWVWENIYLTINEIMKTYGRELILDLHNCDPATFNRKKIKRYFIELCELIDMERCKLSWWDDHGVHPDERQTEPHLKGTTAVQFIMTSNIVIHTLDLMGAVYVNVFSCKDFDPEITKEFTAKWFKGRIVNSHFIERI